MRILVIDDSQIHLAAAKQTLLGHDVTVCSTHDEADRLLEKKYDEKQRDSLLDKYRSENLEDYWDRASKETQLPYWDVVLSDLLMPAGRMSQGGEGLQFVGQEMAVGWSLALRAAKNGAKYVAVVTDMNHHHHPASAMLDGVDGHIFNIDGAKVLLTNHIRKVGITGTEFTCTNCGGTTKAKWDNGKEYDCFYCKSGVDFREKGKDWGDILNRLLDTENKK